MPEAGGSFAFAILTVAPYFVPPPSQKAVQKKQQVDPDKLPKAMQKKETEEEKPKIPLSGQRFRSQQEERHSPGRTAGRGGRRGRFCLSSLHTRVKITSVDKVWCRCDNAA